jgi:major membrane immunogen (membrane-anchored lipoprotein)
LGKGGEPVNLAKIAERLQTALCRKGRPVRIDRMQYFRKSDGRLGTYYRVSEKVFDEESGKNRTEVYYEGGRMVDVVCTLRALYEGGD